MQKAGQFGPASSDSALTPDRVDEVLRPLLSYSHVVLAVSGGSDSTALMVLASEWRDRRRYEGLPIPTLSVATVDHGLRPGSADEAAGVRVLADRLGYPHVVLAWDRRSASGAGQAAAREARYRLLWSHALATAPGGGVAVVTAHTRDDQAETVLMRLARGASVEGLGAMRDQRPLLEGDTRGWLVRPLLDVSRHALRLALEARGIGWIDDPTNNCLDYERARVRAEADARRALGLSDAALARTARRLSEARDGLAWAVSEVMRSGLVEIQAGLWASLDHPGFVALPAALADRLLLRLIAAFGSSSRAPSLQRVEDLRSRMSVGSPERGINVGGCLFRHVGERIWMTREPFRRAACNPPVLSLSPGMVATWDCRFAVSCRASAGHGLSIAPLDVDRERVDQILLGPAFGRLTAPPRVRRDALAGLPLVSANDDRLWPGDADADFAALGTGGIPVLWATRPVGSVAWLGERHL